MLKKAISFLDFDENPQIEVHHFNLTRAELIELELEGDGGSLGEWLKAAARDEDKRKIVKLYKLFILKSYGRREGDKFIKSDELSKEFEHSLAYDALFTEMATVEQASVEFMKGIIPSDLLEKLDDGGALETVDLPAAYKKPEEDERPAWIREDREPTRKELIAMSDEQIKAAFKKKNQVSL
jgi:hypothetical protein